MTKVHSPLRMPAGACDCHAHVFGPFDRFPLSESRSYTPPESPLAAYLAMLDEAGFDRGVLVHAGANGWDNGATLDALTRAPARLRGVAVVPATIDDGALAAMNRAGMRAIRFTHVLGTDPDKEAEGRLSLARLPGFAPRLRALGWHAQLWANADVVAENHDWLRGLGVPIVLDHLGFFDVARGIGDAAFQQVLRLVGDGVAWVKLTLFRNSKTPPVFDDVRPFHDALVRANPERLLWGSDWPFLGMNADPAYATPRLAAKAIDWLCDDALVRRVLVDNPAALYGFHGRGTA